MLKVILLNCRNESRDHKTFIFPHHDLNLKRNTHWGAWRARYWFCSLHQNPDSPNFSRNQTSPVYFSVFEFQFLFHAQLIGFFFIKASIKHYLVSIKISMRVLSTFFRAPEYWQADNPKKAVFDVSSRDRDPSIPLLRAWHLATCFLREAPKLWINFNWQINVILFDSEFWFFENSIFAYTFESSQHSQTSLSITTGVNSCIMVATETVFVLRIVSFNNHPILFFWLNSDGSKLSNFLKEYSRNSNQVFAIKTDLLSFFKFAIWSFLLEFESLFTKSFKLLSSVDWTRTAKRNFSSWQTSVLKPVLLQLQLLF